MMKTICDVLGAENTVPGESVSPFKGASREASLSRDDEVVPVLEDVMVVLAEHGYPIRDRAAVRLALEEAIVNGLRHGNQGDPTRCVRLRYQVTAHALVAEVEDEGSGFDPTGVPDPTLRDNLEKPGGRGLLLMRHFMTWVRYSDRGNRVTLCKHRSR
jgi:serine/threonine-protein kinase RsbW